MEDTRYFARLYADGRDGQTVAEHLLAVADRAAGYGDAFGSRAAAYWAGLLHDLGKYTDAFQRVLKKTLFHIDHAAAGALLQQAMSGSVNAVGRVIFAHHFRLEHAIRRYLSESVSDPQARPPDPKKQTYAVDSAAKLTAAAKLWQREVGARAAEPPPRLPAFGQDRNPALSEMLYLRFLLSCLVDADYSDAAGCEQGAGAQLPVETPLRPDRLLKKLEAYLAEVRKRSTASQEINRLRDRVLSDCRAAAVLPPGLFTLTAPTGLGKTLAMLEFALRHARENNLRRIIIVLPYLSIIEQNVKEYRKIEPGLLEDHSQNNLSDEQRHYAERYSAPLIVTTSVKFFENLFQCRATDCRRIHNIAGSVVLFDEAQSLPPGLTAATLETMRELCGRYRCSVVFSTATQPSFDCRKDVLWEPTEIIRERDDLFRQTRRRCEVDWDTVRKTPFAEIAARMATEQNCCAIVNTKSQAYALFRELKAVCGDAGCSYLTTDLCPSHREAALEAVRQRQENRLPCRVVATQCIEAGVDISFRRLFRALAPLPSIVQSAGRVNRGGEGDPGILTVWVPEGGPQYPDAAYENAAVAVSTLLSRHGGRIDLQDLDQLREYYEILYRDDRHNRDLKKLTDAIAGYDFSGVEEAYRLIDSRGVSVIVPYKEKMELFRQVREEALLHGVTPALMKRAAPITVQTFKTISAQERCVQLYYPCHGRDGYREPSDWYFTDAEVGLYDDVTGLSLSKNADWNTTF